MRLALLLASALVIAATAVAADGPLRMTPDVVDADGREFAVMSTGAWSFGGLGATKARVVQRLRSTGANPKSSRAMERQDYDYLWGRTCSSRRQTVLFAREIVIPGPPLTFGARIDTLNTALIESVRVRVNGRVVLSFAKPLWAVNDEAQYAKPFTFGENRIDVEVTKRATPAGQGACNARGAPFKVGVAFHLFGEFSADLAVEEAGTTESHRKSTGDGVAGALAQSFTNHGPSAATGSLRVNIGVSSFATFKVTRFGLRGEGAGPCAQASATAFAAEIVCSFTNVPPGATLTFEDFVEGDYQPGALSPWISEHWAVSSATDRDGANNTRRHTTYYCRPGATHTGCPK